ncbi:hypothetical protein WJX73_003534 [Symbiochloris irregularis]|uniref:Uncharacterized protein n=1 Tax=Symbiochloris irregularis TaxID=706552 RepID=A0AAW1P8L7_9CHLO
MRQEKFKKEFRCCATLTLRDAALRAATFRVDPDWEALTAELIDLGRLYQGPAIGFFVGPGQVRAWITARGAALGECTEHVWGDGYLSTWEISRLTQAQFDSIGIQVLNAAILVGLWHDEEYMRASDHELDQMLRLRQSWDNELMFCG